MTVALLLAAGCGERLGSERPKAFVELAGRPLVQWSLDVLAASPEIDRVVVATPPEMESLPATVRLPAGALCVPGGDVRSASVRHALALAQDDDPILIHDAARPLLTVDLVQRTLAAAMAEGVHGAIAAAPASDTVKRTEGEPPIVTETLDRANLWAVQTPQVFRREALERALQVSDEVLAAATDDAWLVERMGGRIAVVPSHTANLKITTPVDLELATLLLARRPV
jgi:2-C-methyl-D-erythritol 4-phosphate cytidylyltransferase